MEPSAKSHAMETFLEEQFGRTTAIKANLCIPPPYGCGQSIGEFRTEMTKREYTISGLCQACQDKAFGK